VTGTDHTAERWSIGELARASGTTVRALRHYDEIGLLSPSARTAAGHRRYTEHDLRRLYRVRALRSLGLSLAQVGRALDGSPDDLGSMRELLTAQLRGLEVRAVRVRELVERVQELLSQVEGRSMPGPDQFMTILEMISVFETYFNQDQRDRLAERRYELGPDAVEAAKREWVELVDALLPHVAADTPAADPRVRVLVERWDAIGARFHDGATEETSAARAMWRENSAELAARLPWPADRMIALVAYLERIREGG
jgi:DNA-binding transcriptional MerR regulator